MSLQLPNIIVGLTGRRGSGKSTAARMLNLEVPLKWNLYNLAFGEYLKEDLANLVGGTVATINKNKNTPTLRKVLQFVGDIRREENPAIYTNKITEFINNPVVKSPWFIIISDVRFLHEANFIRSYPNSFIFRVQRPYKIYFDSSIDNHPSETEQDQIKVDLHILNHQTEKHLQFEMQMLLTYIIDNLKLKI